MGVAAYLELGQHRVHAGHATAAQLLQPLGQRTISAEVISGGIVGAKPPVEAVGVFAPAQDLANHPFQARQGRTPLQPCLLQPADHLKRLQQANVEIRGEQGVPQGGLAADHGVLERAEAIEPRIDEMFQHRQRLAAGNCPPERRTNPW